MSERRALGEVNPPADAGAPADSFKNLRVSTSPAAHKGRAPLLRPGLRTPADFPQLFTPGGCPIDADDCYEDFGTTFISGPKKVEPPPPMTQALRQRGGAAEGADAKKQPRRTRLATMSEEDEPGIACFEPQCTVS